MRNDKSERTVVTTKSGELTRRRFVDRVLLTMAGAAIIVVSSPQRAEAKVSKMAAKYQSSSRGGSSCSNCLRYQGNGKCSKVSGRVSSGGWCRYYTA